MTQELEKLANSPVKFELDGKVYLVRKLSILQLADIRQSIYDSIKSDYKKDIAELITNLPANERSKYLQESLKSFRIDDNDVNQRLMGRDGIIAVLKVVLKLGIDKIVEYLNNSEIQDQLWEIFAHAMSIKDEETKSEAKEDTEKKG